MYIVEITYPRQNWPLQDFNFPEASNYKGYLYNATVGGEQRMISFCFEEFDKAKNFEQDCKQNTQLSISLRHL